MNLKNENAKNYLLSNHTKATLEDINLTIMCGTSFIEYEYYNFVTNSKDFKHVLKVGFLGHKKK